MAKALLQGMVEQVFHKACIVLLVEDYRQTVGEEAEAWGGRLEWGHDVRLCLKLGWGFGLDHGTVAFAFQPMLVVGPMEVDKKS